MNRRHLTAIALALVLGSGTAFASGQFSYQGKLDQANAPVSGNYDLRFTLYGALSGGSPVSGAGITNPVTRSNVSVADGSFSVQLDFGDVAFTGAQRWLAIEVKPASGGSFAALSPRQAVTPALRALYADDAAITQTVPDGSVGTADIVTSQVQRRITGSCPVDQAIAKINEDGSVVCAAARTSNITRVQGRKGITGNGTSGTVALSLTPDGIVAAQIADAQIGTVALADGAVTTAKIAPGAVNLSKINSNEVQRRVGSACPAGRVVQRITQGGAVQCGVTDWDGINNNVISGSSATVSGGTNNTASGANSVISGGGFNTASGEYATVTGGAFNHASGGYSTITGGSLNGATGWGSAVLGGFDNCAGGTYSLAMGRRAKVRPGSLATLVSGCLDVAKSTHTNGDQGTFIFADSQDADFVSTGANQFLVRAKNGVLFNRDSNTVSLPAGRFINTETGAYLSSGGTWTNASSRTLKTAFRNVDASRIFDQVLTLPMSTWQYIAAPEAGRHLGPVAEDFRAMFALGDRDDEISTADAGGVALAAVQGLAQKQDAALETLTQHASHDTAQVRAGIAALRARIEAMRAAHVTEAQP
ncbi:hypothetical protein OS187_03365 [Xanthomonadaceae bacterium JHOS43]|nr:hypothetical protein [Xanthomonadaceae bacterium JHOS43]